MRVRKAVIPAAGRGTRFLPASRAIPKEMLPIVDKPTIQYVVEEAVASGLEDVIFVTSQGKSAIEDHFDRDVSLEQALAASGKEDLCELVRQLAKMVNVSSVRQKQPLGLGHAVLTAQHLVGDEPFGVFLGDDIIDNPGDNSRPAMAQLLDVHRQYGASVIAVMEVDDDAISRYGCVAVEGVDAAAGRLFRVTDLVEKPSREEAPSNLAVIGRYLLTPAIFPALEQTTPGALGEIQLTDGLQRLADSEPLYAYRFKGRRFDAGNKLEYLIAGIEFGLRHKEIGEGLRRYLREELELN